ncbi:HvfX family Cu-binding RiPP maturation protein [Pseudoalteromonas ruthenica]|uniref:HvfX family Cu-binding RiPP maturation protein n=1 Tax=Pseudoalteromonas ruthenica TaxID=151081 RepID=UPI00110B68A5|nr:DoxX family protein [Pseudoalteromonas ruthenica]TMO47177.1 quinol oxidase [Pseudoalteromonas ruthenica]TMO51351.1 quinol oxidase [Pseudoalteromonas ruthenica]
MLTTVTGVYRSLLSQLSFLDGLPSLCMRLILAPVMIIAGFNKLNLANSDLAWSQRLLADANVIAWFGNSDWGLGLPFAEVLAFLAGWTEFLGGWLILVGLFTRLVSIPLMFTMVVAATTVHWHNGWFAITPTNPDTSAAKVLDWVGAPGAQQSLENSIQAKQRLDIMKKLIAENGRPEYLYETGNIVILNNGVEFASIYFAMLLALFFYGGGRFVSLDYYLRPAPRE